MSQLLVSLPDDLTAILSELGIPEVNRRIDDLSDYYKWDTVATHYGLDGSLTPAQLIAWAKFAETLGKEFVIGRDGEVKRPKGRDELVKLVLIQERDKR